MNQRSTETSSQIACTDWQNHQSANAQRQDGAQNLLDMMPWTGLNAEIWSVCSKMKRSDLVGPDGDAMRCKNAFSKLGKHTGITMQDAEDLRLKLWLHTHEFTKTAGAATRGRHH